MFIILINLLVCVDLNCSFSFCVPETKSKETQLHKHNEV